MVVDAGGIHYFCYSHAILTCTKHLSTFNFSTGSSKNVGSSDNKRGTIKTVSCWLGHGLRKNRKQCPEYLCENNSTASRDHYSHIFARINLNFSPTDFNVSFMVAAILSVIPNVVMNERFD